MAVNTTEWEKSRVGAFAICSYRAESSLTIPPLRAASALSFCDRGDAAPSAESTALESVKVDVAKLVNRIAAEWGRC